MRVICVAPLNAKLGFAQILWFLNQNTVRLQTSPPRSGMACVSTSQRLLGCNQSGASWWQNTEANPVLPLTTGGLWPISPSPNFCLNQKFILKQCSSFQDWSRLFRSKQCYTAGLSTPNRQFVTSCFQTTHSAKTQLLVSKFFST